MYPEVSIVIPTLNRSHLLETTLTSIFTQQMEAPFFEVIVVDNGSVDATREVCETFSVRYTNFVYCYDKMPGQLTGRHRGLELSSGKILAYLDDDVVLNSSWIANLLTVVRKYPNIAIFGGPSVPAYGSTPPDWVKSFWQKTPYGGAMCLPLSLIDLGPNELEIDPLYVFGLNFAIKRNELIRLKGFHPDCIPSHLQKFQGDGETGLAIKARQCHVKALYSPSLSLSHQIPTERLTVNFFKKWSFYNGVCQSFTDLRASNGKVDVKQVSRVWTILKQTVGGIKGVINHVTLNADNRLIKSINDQYLKGYKFHQNAFFSDPIVRDWVLKSDFLNYSLPYAN
jgi:glycosyltransferase involved in cell wall biosynthesis